ncbi:hypothetical protein [Cryobacterium luteum]|uniref:Uncharacterized protein n=1 Tax=Cryobacterium luteum TaxID=1424661 RepID=A0A1H8LQV3_9MICO|nr:hypothetical protein [Cryobacterium luteum]TFB89937.1 hypothetical protein E3O10_07360 [Cryobacterium luteum]SEO07469.1 hypothetical protein SAMN05216281_13022 [Cryobacterium luteum]
MDHSHPNDIFIKAGGVEVEKPPLVIDGDNTLSGTHNGSVCVHDGTLIILRGATHNGSLTVQPSAHVTIHGVHNGSLTIGSSATSEVLGAQNGSVHVDVNGALRVAIGGRLAGSLTVAGRIENAGVRGGTVTKIGGEVIDLPGSTIKEARRSAEGANVISW